MCRVRRLPDIVNERANELETKASCLISMSWSVSGRKLIFFGSEKARERDMKSEIDKARVFHNYYGKSLQKIVLSNSRGMVVGARRA